MKILTWNIERLKTLSKNEAVISIINQHDADIIVLTETTSVIHPGAKYTSVQTLPLPQVHDGVSYKPGENRVTIFTNYPITKTYTTFDDYTALCAKVETPFGSLKIYGTIIGVFGGRGKRFNEDLNEQLNDFERLLLHSNACIIGDLNTTFSGYVYPSHAARQTLSSYFENYNLTNVTASIADNVDHIVITNSFLNDKKVAITIFNQDKKLSDHIGICTEII